MAPFAVGNTGATAAATKGALSTDPSRAGLRSSLSEALHTALQSASIGEDANGIGTFGTEWGAAEVHVDNLTNQTKTVQTSV